MKQVNIIALILIITVICSCSEKNDIINTEYPSVEIKKIVYEEEEDGGYGMAWPEFHSENKELEEKLNNLLSMSAILGQSYEEILAESESSVKEFGMPQGIISSNYWVTMNEGFILDISFSSVSIGAHEYYSDHHEVINLKTVTPIDIKEIIREESIHEIVSTCDKEVKEQAERILFETKEAEGVDLSEEGYGDVSFSEEYMSNFTITPGGIWFSRYIELPQYMRAYQPPDLRCYFNFKDYKGIVKEGSVLHEYIESNGQKISELAEKEKSEGEEEGTPEYTSVKTKAGLENAIMYSEDGAIIMVENDIDVGGGISVKRSNITITGDQTKKPKIYTTDPEALIFDIMNSENLTVRNLSFRHITDGVTCVSGIFSLENSHKVTIENCDISGCGAWGIYVLNDCSKISIHRNKIYDCSYYGIELLAENCEIKGNKFYRNGDYNDDIEVDEELAELNDIENNTHYGWNKDDCRVKEIERIMRENDPVEKEFNTEVGKGKVTAYYYEDEMVYLKIDWNENYAEIKNEFSMEAHLGRRVPVEVKWQTIYSADSGMDEQTVIVKGSSSEKRLDHFYKGDGISISDITDNTELYNLRLTLNRFLDKWIDILNGKQEVEEAFDKLFFNTSGELVL